MITCSNWARSQSQQNFAKPILEGLARHGVKIVAPYTQADIGIVWGVRRRSVFQACQHVLVMERAYLGDRFHWLSLGWDGLNGRAKFFNDDVPNDRWKKFWRDQMQDETPGNGTLVIGQVAGDMATQGVDLYQWGKQVGEGLNSLGVDWRFRPHPVAVKRHQKQPFRSDTRPLEQALAECDSVITYNSNVGVLAAMAGKRVTCEDDGSMAYEVAGHGWMDDRGLGDRDEWGRKLAYCQWLPEELPNGQFWETLGRIFQ